MDFDASADNGISLVGGRACPDEVSDAKLGKLLDILMQVAVCGCINDQVLKVAELEEAWLLHNL